MKLVSQGLSAAAVVCLFCGKAQAAPLQSCSKVRGVVVV